MPYSDIQSYHQLILVTVRINTRCNFAPQFDCILAINPPMRTASAADLAEYSSVLTVHHRYDSPHRDSPPGQLPSVFWKPWKNSSDVRGRQVIATMNLGTVLPEHYQELSARLCDSQIIAQHIRSSRMHDNNVTWHTPDVIQAVLRSITPGLLQTEFPIDYVHAKLTMEVHSIAALSEGTLTEPFYEVSPPKL